MVIAPQNTGQFCDCPCHLHTTNMSEAASEEVAHLPWCQEVAFMSHGDIDASTTSWLRTIVGEESKFQFDAVEVRDKLLEISRVATEANGADASALDACQVLDMDSMATARTKMENIRRWTIDQQGSGHKKLAVNCLAALHTRRNLDTVCADAQGLTIPVKAILNECITRSGGAKSALPRQVDHLMKTITWSAAVEGRYQMLSGADVNTRGVGQGDFSFQ